MNDVHDTITEALRRHVRIGYDESGTPWCECGAEWNSNDGHAAHVAEAIQAALDSRGFVVRKREEPADTFTMTEVRISLTAFAMWLLAGEAGEGREVELVDRFIQETT